MAASHQNILSMHFSKDIFEFLQLDELGAIYSVNPDIKTNKPLTFFIKKRLRQVIVAYNKINSYVKLIERHGDYYWNLPKLPKIWNFSLAKYYYEISKTKKKHYYDISKSDIIKDILVKALELTEDNGKYHSWSFTDEQYRYWSFRFVLSLN